MSSFLGKIVPFMDTPKTLASVLGASITTAQKKKKRTYSSRFVRVILAQGPCCEGGREG